jgi:hypothetical protein
MDTELEASRCLHKTRGPVALSSVEWRVEQGSVELHPTWFFFFWPTTFRSIRIPALNTEESRNFQPPSFFPLTRRSMHTFCHVYRVLIRVDDLEDPFTGDAHWHQPRAFSSYLVQLFLSIPSSIFTPDHPAAFILGDRHCLDHVLVGLDILTLCSQSHMLLHCPTSLQPCLERQTVAIFLAMPSVDGGHVHPF